MVHEHRSHRWVQSTATSRGGDVALPPGQTAPNKSGAYVLYPALDRPDLSLCAGSRLPPPPLRDVLRVSFSGRFSARVGPSQGVHRDLSEQRTRVFQVGKGGWEIVSADPGKEVSSFLLEDRKRRALHVFASLCLPSDGPSIPSTMLQFQQVV